MFLRAGDTSQWSNSYFSEDMSSVPSMYNGQLITLCNNSSREIQCTHLLWKSEDNLEEYLIPTIMLILGIELGDKCLYLLSNVASHHTNLLNKNLSIELFC